MRRHDGQDYRETVLAMPGIIAYWRLGEASGTVAADSSGKGHTGTYVGSPTLGVTGLLSGDPGLAMLTASGKKVTFSEFALPNDSSMLFWINFSSINGSDWNRFAGGFDGAPSFGLQNNNTLRMGQDGVGEADPVSWSPVTGRTYFVAYTYNRTNGIVTYYVDGEQYGAATSPYFPTWGGAGNRLQVLSGNKFGNAPFTGTLDEALILERVVSPGEIAHLFRLGRGL